MAAASFHRSPPNHSSPLFKLSDKEKRCLRIEQDKVEPIAVVQVLDTIAECCFRLFNFSTRHTPRTIQDEDTKSFSTISVCLHLIFRRNEEHKVPIFLLIGTVCEQGDPKVVV